MWTFFASLFQSLQNFSIGKQINAASGVVGQNQAIADNNINTIVNVTGFDGGIFNDSAMLGVDNVQPFYTGGFIEIMESQTNLSGIFQIKIINNELNFNTNPEHWHRHIFEHNTPSPGYMIASPVNYNAQQLREIYSGSNKVLNTGILKAVNPDRSKVKEIFDKLFLKAKDPVMYKYYAAILLVLILLSFDE